MKVYIVYSLVCSGDNLELVRVVFNERRAKEQVEALEQEDYNRAMNKYFDAAKAGDPWNQKLFDALLKREQEFYKYGYEIVDSDLDKLSDFVYTTTR